MIFSETKLKIKVKVLSRTRRSWASACYWPGLGNCRISLFL